MGVIQQIRWVSYGMVFVKCMKKFEDGLCAINACTDGAFNQSGEL